IEADAYKGVDLTGHIASIGAVLDPATRRVQVRCVVPNPLRLLRPEMYARISNAALLNRGVYNSVFVETEPGLFRKRQVEVGLQDRDETYVKSGLKEGERVVVSGALLLDSELASRQ